jgi:hypothetical protein
MAAESSSTFSAEYFPLEGDGEPADILSPVPYRDEASLHNNRSERICFDEETFETRDEDNSLPLLNNNNNSGSSSRRYNRGRLSGLNYLNAVTYVAHLFVSWGIGVWGLDGILDTRWEISTRYETLVTPAKWAYYLWAPILILEGFFAVAQLIPHYRARPIIQAGTGFYFFYTFLIQTVWTLCFSFQYFVCSFVAVLAALVSLGSLLASQKSALMGQKQSLLEYCLFCFPFYLHTGWMVLMTVDHLSLLSRALEASIGLQLATDIVSLGIMLAVAALCCLASPSWQDFVIPIVILWSFVSVLVMGCSRLWHQLQCSLHGNTKLTFNPILLRIHRSVLPGDCTMRVMPWWSCTAMW